MKRFAVAAILALAMAPANGAQAGPAAAGELPSTITLVSGFAPGGGDGQGGSARGQGVASLRPQPRYDLIARLYVRHMSAFLPGKPTIVLRHMPGGGSGRAASWLFNRAPRDGSHLGVVSGNALRELALRGRGEAVRAVTVIGAMEGGEYVCAGRRDPKSLAEGFVFGATAPRERTFLHARAYSAASGRPLRIVAGYGNTAQLALAFRRGEVDGFCGLSLATLRSQLGPAMASGELVPYARFAASGSGGLAQVPRVSSLPNAGFDAQTAAALRLMDSQGLLDWTLLAPPALDQERTAMLRQGYAAMLASTIFRADAVRWGLAVDPPPLDALIRAQEALASPGKGAREKIEEWSRLSNQ